MINWGFIGCGAVTELKSGPAFKKAEGSDVVAVMRRNIEKAKDYAMRHKIDRYYNDAQELINDPGVNAIYVATPPGSHAEYAIAAMKAGKPVYIEKPMAASYQECVDINRVSADTGVPCFVAYYRRTLPYFLKVKQIIDEGVLGKLSTVQIRFAIPPYKTDYNRSTLPWRVKKDLSGAGYFYDLASHQIDLLNFILGDISEVNGFTTNIAGLYDVEDTVTAALRFKSGVLASGSWSFVAPPNTRTDTIEFVGTEGKLSCSTFNFSPVILETSNGREEFEIENPENIQFYLIQSIVNYLNKKGEMPVSTGISAQKTNLIMDQILGYI